MFEVVVRYLGVCGLLLYSALLWRLTNDSLVLL